NRMAPGVSRLESQPVREAAVEPKLKRVVTRIPGGLGHINGAKALVYAGGVDQVLDTVRIESHRLSDLESGAPRHIVVGHAATPDVNAMVPDVRGFDHGVLQDLAGDREVPLPAIGRTEVWIGSRETGV